jgi:hypothetical protein
VPTLTGNAWFAAVSKPYHHLHHPYPTTTSRRIQQPEKSAELIVLRKANTLTSQGGPFANESYTATVEEFNDLKQFFNSWHDPIPQLLENTENAPTSSTPNSSNRDSGIKNMPSTPPSLTKSTISTSETSTSPIDGRNKSSGVLVCDAVAFNGPRGA